MIRKLLTKWTERRRKTAFQEGYDWAAGQLLSGTMCTHEIEYAASGTFTLTNTKWEKHFNEGANKAVHDFVQKIGEPKCPPQLFMKSSFRAK